MRRSVKAPNATPQEGKRLIATPTTRRETTAPRGAEQRGSDFMEMAENQPPAQETSLVSGLDPGSSWIAQPLPCLLVRSTGTISFRGRHEQWPEGRSFPRPVLTGTLQPAVRVWPNRPSTHWIQAAECSGGGAEPAQLDAQPLQQADVEVTQGRRV